MIRLSNVDKNSDSEGEDEKSPSDGAAELDTADDGDKSDVETTQEQADDAKVRDAANTSDSDAPQGGDKDSCDEEDATSGVSNRDVTVPPDSCPE